MVASLGLSHGRRSHERGARPFLFLGTWPGRGLTLNLKPYSGHHTHLAHLPVPRAACSVYSDPYTAAGNSLQLIRYTALSLEHARLEDGASLIFFLRNACHTSHAHGQTAPPCHRPHSTLSIVRRLYVAYKWLAVSMLPLTDKSEPWFHVHSILLP